MRSATDSTGGATGDLEALERAFWFGDADFYRVHLTPDCVMVFPGMGITGRDALIAGIEAGPRWSHVSIARWHRRHPRSDVAVVAYRATAMREGMDHPYLADCGSLYVRIDGEWRLAFHQQTPV